MIKYDWTKPFVIGSSFIIKRIEELGYDKDVIAHTRNKVVKNYIIPHIIYDKKNGETKLSRYQAIYKNYKSSFYFWVYCLPLMLLPSFIIKLLIKIKRKL
jgi:hypothetical protein